MLSALVVATAVLFGFAQPASASAGRCNYGGAADRCVYVKGSGLYVNYIDADIYFVTGQYLEIEIWGDGIYYRGHGDVGWPSDMTHKRLNINKNLANHSWVCVTARTASGAQVTPAACVEIHN
ncbi:hypothetical protein ACFY2Q_27630 [Micromonospora sp. NPDC000316]|uniref:hypothetical protein n=1 Tax=Micromonospora sp. NPDC000316 TaxID=3364216 RepID=UPI00367BB104